MGFIQGTYLPFNQNRSLYSVLAVKTSSWLLQFNFCVAMKFYTFFFLSHTSNTNTHKSHEYLYNASFSGRGSLASHRCYKFWKTELYFFLWRLVEGSWFCFDTKDVKIVLICQAHLVQHKPLQRSSVYPDPSLWFEDKAQIQTLILH